VQQRPRRLAFCEKYKTWTAQNWEAVMFSDESSFKLWGNGSKFVRRPIGQRYNPAYTLPTVKNFSTLMIWGCFSSFGRGRLHFVPKGTTINAVKYRDILEDKLLLAMDTHNTTIFQHDNAPCHAAKSVSQFLDRHKIQVLDWPGNSPDLNPIENLWNVIKRKVRAKNPKTVDELKQAIVQVWVRDITPDYCRKLVHSMPKRISEVKKNHGFPTKY